MKPQKVNAMDVLRLIPDEELARLAADTKVDYCAKVLTGERMFYLLVYAFLAADEVGQRRLEWVFNSSMFKSLFNLAEGVSVTHGSISTRLKKIDVGFFEKAFELLYARLSSMYSAKEMERYNIVRVDSTMVAETCNKLMAGFNVGKKPGGGRPARRQIKYTVAYDGFAAKLAGVFSEPRYLSEDAAMPEVLRELVRKDARHDNLYVLDRGFSSLENYEGASRAGAKFVGRIKTGRRMETVRSLAGEGADRDLGALELVEDVEVRLFDRKANAFSETTFRVVKARRKVAVDTSAPKGKGKARRTENEVYFITNDMEMTPQEVAYAYKRRWDVEVFIKFLKQNLSFSHFISTNENGIKVILYMTLITAMLVMIYKKENGMGFSLAKFAFYIQMQDWICSFVAETGHKEWVEEAYREMVRRKRVP